LDGIVNVVDQDFGAMQWRQMMAAQKLVAIHANVMHRERKELEQDWTFSEGKMCWNVPRVMDNALVCQMVHKNTEKTQLILNF
jgi:hypothetical protein